jgi:hypothetical protein
LTAPVFEAHFAAACSPALSALTPNIADFLALIFSLANIKPICHTPARATADDGAGR